MRQPSIVVVGSSNTDMIVRLERIPRPGETILGGDFLTAAGGKGANQAVAAARAGAHVRFIARVGQDMFGDQAVSGFLRDGIDASYILRDSKAPSGVALIFVSAQGENSIGVASGANAHLSPADLLSTHNAFQEAGTLLVQLETPVETVHAAVEMANRYGLRVILNPAPAMLLPDSLLRLVTILTPNQTEAELLTGMTFTNDESAIRAAHSLRARGPSAVIITLGARGSLVSTSDSDQFVPGFPVAAVDSTAAGDIYNGALAVALEEGSSLLEAARFASAAAALSVTRMGAQPSAPSRTDIVAFLNLYAHDHLK